VVFPLLLGCGSVAAMDLFKPPEALCKSEPPASHKTNQKPIFFLLSHHQKPNYGSAG
jgi:hypothetical protein